MLYVQLHLWLNAVFWARFFQEVLLRHAILLSWMVIWREGTALIFRLTSLRFSGFLRSRGILRLPRWFVVRLSGIIPAPETVIFYRRNIPAWVRPLGGITGTTFLITLPCAGHIFLKVYVTDNRIILYLRVVWICIRLLHRRSAGLLRRWPRCKLWPRATSGERTLGLRIR